MKKKLIELIIRIITGLVPVSLLWLFVYNYRNEYGYGMVILPLIIISIILFVIFFFVGRFISDKFK